MSYIDETFYTDDYHGFTVPSLKFSYYSERATDTVNEYIDALEVASVTEEVKKCTCAVMDQLYKIENPSIDATTLTSESVGSYKRSFKDSTPSKSNNNKIYDIVLKYLGKSGLLYRGATYVY